MFQNKVVKSPFLPATLFGLAVGLALTGCGRSGPEPQSSPAADSMQAADAAREDQIKAREDELAKREAELAAKEQEQAAASKEAEEAAQKEREAAEKTAAAKKAATAAKAAATRSTAASSNASNAAPKPAPRPAPKPIDVPSGTQLTVALSSDLTSKTAKAGDPFESRLVSDLVIGERVAVPSGTRVTGTITDVVSGSKAIGAIPMLGLKFDSLVLENGRQIPIRGELREQGKSEKGRDTAKILGGVAAGAILGHQVKKGDSGKVIGGLLGGAVGAVAAKKTGTEVQLPAGSTLTISLGEGFRVERP